MYLDFYDLEKEPFNVTPDPDFFYLSPSHREALAAMIYGIEQRKGFIGIVGEVGVGKTTVLRSCLDSMDPSETRLAYIINANLAFPDLLKAIYRELKLDIPSADPPEMVSHLHEILIDEYNRNHNVVLIIDEAQNVPDATLENLRMLSNLETSKDKLIQIVLIGQPELQQRLDQKNLRQLKQRIAVRHEIRPLTEKESLEYIRHRLAKAGADSKKVFTDGAAKAIAKKAGGIPRIINILCDNALITGFGYGQKPVSARVVREIIADFDGKARRSFTRWVVASSLLAILIAALVWFYYFDGLALLRDQRTSAIHSSPAVSARNEPEIPEKDSLPSTQAPSGLLPKVQGQGKPPASAAKPRVDPGREGETRSGVDSNLPAGPVVTPGTVKEPEMAQSREDDMKPTVGSNSPGGQGAAADPVQEAELDQNLMNYPKPEPGLDPPVEQMAPSVEEEAKSSNKPVKSISRVVKRGDNLTRLIREVYGFADEQLVEWVKRNNPQLRNADTILVGTEIVFPEMTEEENGGRRGFDLYEQQNR